ncbi:hypothetical protein WICPIJ_005289 [Wickerhamomyces pijperi]|uniref:3'(2'),5'-bisphosphate nucleotidase n=1 Tax=Wickerhamomyces pijperi TaxID=599730 RepID=A0A9P8Q3T1_WICPI|nr:hypothetical protein WICPIJ_005289 [Wickerhamomyces pijperi]
MLLSKEAFIARLAVQKASYLTRSITEQILANKSSNTITKEDNSPVTIGDFSAQAVIINAIKANFPNDEVIGEEDSHDLKENLNLAQTILKELNKNEESYQAEFPNVSSVANLGPSFTSVEQVSSVIDQGNSLGGNKGRYWALDPIDGTKGFLRGDQYAVCLALIIDGEVELGVIGCPNLPDNLEDPQYKGGLFVAIKGQGSFYSPLYGTEITHDNLGERIHMKNGLSSSSQLRVVEGVEKGHSSHSDQSQIKQRLQIPEGQTLNLDSQVKYCALAKGLADLYLRLPINLKYREKVWDHAAGNVLIKESGGVVSDMQGNQLDFGKGRYLDSLGVIASNKNFHDDVIGAVKQVVKL